MEVIKSDPQRVANNLKKSSAVIIANLMEEKAFYQSAFEEAQEKIKELEEKNAKKK